MKRLGMLAGARIRALCLKLSIIAGSLLFTGVACLAQNASATNTGWVVLPVSEYTALRRAAFPADAEPAPPPVEATLTRIDYDLKVDGDLASGKARLTKVFGRCEPKTGIAPFDRLVAQVMAQEPYRSAKRVFWIIDNGSAHRGLKAIARLQEKWPTIIPVHTPVHASWLNQIEIYFSVVQQKVLTPNDIRSLAELEERLLRFQDRYQEIAKPFHWTFTRKNLAALMAQLDSGSKMLKAA